MAQNLSTIAFDADDTLWQNEQFFRLTQDKFANLLAEYTDKDTLHDRLLRAERKNLGHYGYGVKGFVLSMIETAIDVTNGQIPNSVISDLLDAGRDMLEHPIELLPDVETTLTTLSHDFRLIVITKGDLLDQERKIAQSGLGDLFDAVDIVSDKTSGVYTQIFDRFDGASRSMMVGNSLKSDVIPALNSGGWGVHVPHEFTWALETADMPTNDARYHTLQTLGDLPDLIASL